MAYTICIPVSLGASKAGLTLAARLVDDAGQNYGSEITGGFAEIGAGNYLWKYTAFEEGFRGGVKFYQSGASGTILAFAAINPQETEAAMESTTQDIKDKTDCLPGDTQGTLSDIWEQCYHSRVAAEAVQELNVDSTGGQLSMAKALEVTVARCVGDLAYNASSGVVTFYGRDGATTVATVKLTGGGNRTESAIP